MTAMSVIALCLATLIFVGLPFVPAIIEWRRKTDANPLSVVYASAVDVRHFAVGFHRFVMRSLDRALGQCRSSGTSYRGMLQLGVPYMIVADDGEPLLTEDESANRSSRHIIASTVDLQLPERTMFLPEIYGEGVIRGGRGDIYRAVYSERDIILDEDSLSLRWLHARRSVSVKSRSVLFGRVTAERFIRLYQSCRFERVNAPTVEFGSKNDIIASLALLMEPEREPLLARDIPERLEVKAGTWFVRGDLDILGGKILSTNLVVTGNLTIAADTCIVGSIKSHKDVHLERGVDIRGSVVSNRDIAIDGNCTIDGPVIAERAITVGGGVVFGKSAAATTVSAETIHIDPGVVAHGTVWARSDGRVGDTAIAGAALGEANEERYIA